MRGERRAEKLWIYKDNLWGFVTTQDLVTQSCKIIDYKLNHILKEQVNQSILIYGTRTILFSLGIYISHRLDALYPSKVLQHKLFSYTISSYYMCIFNRSGVARAVLQTALSLIESLTE